MKSIPIFLQKTLIFSFHSNEEYLMLLVDPEQRQMFYKYKLYQNGHVLIYESWSQNSNTIRDICEGHNSLITNTFHIWDLDFIVHLKSSTWWVWNTPN